MNTDPAIERSAEEDPPPDFIPEAALPYIVSSARYTGGAIATCVATIPGMAIASRLPNLGGDILISGPETFLTKVAAMGIGFFSVLIGTLLVPKPARHITSWAYTMVGAFWYIWVWMEAVYKFIHRAAPSQPLPPFLPMLPWALLGGVACSLLFIFLWKRNLRDR